MSNRILRTTLQQKRLSIAEAELWIHVEVEQITAGIELRGRFTGPKCPGIETVQIAYPLRPLPRSDTGISAPSLFPNRTFGRWRNLIFTRERSSYGRTAATAMWRMLLLDSRCVKQCSVFSFQFFSKSTIHLRVLSLHLLNTEHYANISLNAAANASISASVLNGPGLTLTKPSG